MIHIFISYRRADSQSIVERMVDHMEKPSEIEVFQDVEDIRAGEEFPDRLSREIERCDVVLVVIGPRWLTIAEDNGRRRLDDPTDYVRIEIETALRHSKRIIPVLVKDEGAIMPVKSDLPESLRDLCDRNAFHIHHNPNFRHDIKTLIKRIEQMMSPSAEVVLPSFEWILIPDGKVTLIAGGYVPEGGMTYTVEPFTIAKYPVTNAQFQVFIEAKDGYPNAEWWNYSSEAKQRRAGRQNPQNTSFPGGDLPRTNVSWYDAVAFCRWLSSRTGQEMRLPTEQEWQLAAQGDDGRPYPWGTQFDEKRCNFNSYSPSPVTQYPSGASPYGVMDMSGNVYEWCSTKYETGVDDLSGTDKRVQRGGSWRSDKIDYCRVDYRYGDSPGTTRDFRGFRLARSI